MEPPCCLTLCMKHAHNDNNDTWQLLSAPTERVLQSDKQKNEKPGGNADRGDDTEKKEAEHGAYVDQRLSDFTAFERRARGNNN